MVGIVNGMHEPYILNWFYFYFYPQEVLGILVYPVVNVRLEKFVKRISLYSSVHAVPIISQNEKIKMLQHYWCNFVTLISMFNTLQNKNKQF